MSILSQRNFKFEGDCRVIDDEFGEGTFNKVKLVENNGRKYILRSPKKQKNVEPTKYNYNENIYDSALSFYHTKLFSNIVKQNIIPNYPILYSYTTNNGIYKTFIEYANVGNMHNIEKNNDILYPCIVQTFLALYYQNTVMNISHNDCTLANILIKKIEPVHISYKIHDKKYINIFTDHIAILSDFDKTRGNLYCYKNMYIILHYINSVFKTLLHVDHLDNISVNYKSHSKNTPNKIFFTDIAKILNTNKNPLKFDIVVMMVTLYKSKPNLVKNFLVDYIFKDKSIMKCIAKYFGKYINITKTCPKYVHENNIFVLYKDTFDYSDLSYKNRKKLITNVMHNYDVRGIFLNKYIINEFNLNDFYNKNVIRELNVDINSVKNLLKSNRKLVETPNVFGCFVYIINKIYPMLYNGYTRANMTDSVLDFNAYNIIYMSKLANYILKNNFKMYNTQGVCELLCLTCYRFSINDDYEFATEDFPEDYKLHKKIKQHRTEYEKIFTNILDTLIETK